VNAPPNHRELLQLESDPDRQAAHILRGYIYQVWCSVEAWLALKDAETLGLEGAEDFDVISLSVPFERQVEELRNQRARLTATATQVKDLSSSLTLRSSETREAIANYWEHRQKNSRYRVRFRFLTSTRSGIERGNPFGPGVSGMEFWNRAARTGEGVGRLRDFLQKLDLADAVQRFLASATPEEIREKLLVPLEWRLEQGSIEDVEAAIQRQLICYGEERNIPADDAKNVTAHLFVKAAGIASRKDPARVLYRADFLEIWREKTSRRMDFGQARVAAQVFGLLLPAVTGPTFELPTRCLVSSPPSRPVQLAPRSALVTSLGAVLAETRQLVLTGSTGVGKSTIAKLIVAVDWIWAPLSEDRAVNRKVFETLWHRLLTNPSPAGVVLDDFIPEQLDESSLGGLLRYLEDRAIPFIITTSRGLPSRVAVSLNLSPMSLVTVPVLGLKETEEFLGACGCPAAYIPVLAPLLVALTSGHPQLVHAWIRDLSRSAWEALPLQEVFLDHKSVREIQAEARSLLRRLPEGARTLAYRLSIMRQPFLREQALEIAAIPPALALPGEAFDLLSGPWIEGLSNRYFRVSPLLIDAASEVWPDTRPLHRSLAHVLLRSPRVTQIEAISGFFHAFWGEDESEVLLVANALLGAESAIQKAIFPSLAWFSYIGVDSPMSEFILPTERRLILRMFQYRLAAEESQKAKIAALWDQESQRLPVQEEPRSFYRFQFTTTVLIDPKSRHSIRQLLGWLRESVESAVETARQKPSFDISGSLSDPDVSDELSDPATALFLFVLVRSFGAEDLVDLFESLTAMDEPFRDRLLRIFDIIPGLATHLMDDCWLVESEKAESDWCRCLAVLKEAQEASKGWRCESLRVAAISTQATIIHDGLKDTNQALKLLQEELQGKENFLLADQKASLLQEIGENSAALEIWQEGLVRWTLQDGLETTALTLAFKKAGISAGRLGEWEEAAGLFLMASTKASTYREDYLERDAKGGQEEGNSIPVLQLALLADHAFALFRAGKRLESLMAFERVIAGLEDLGANLRGLDEYRGLAKVVGHMLLWLDEPAHLAEPPPGMASSQRVTPELLSSPATGIDYLWVFLCLLESTCDGNTRVLERARETLSNSSDAKVVHCLYQAEIGHALRRGQVERLSSLMIALCRPVTGQPRAACVLNGLFFGLLSLAHHRPGIEPPWDRWLADLEAVAPQERPVIDGWIQLAKEVFPLEPGQLQTVLRQCAGDDPRIPFLAVRIAAGQGFSPAIIFQSQIVLATLFRGLERPQGDLVSAVVETGWRRLLETPAALFNPRLSAPEIRTACESQACGLDKAAAILLAAESAVHVRIDAHRRQVLTALRDGAESTLS
jgi:hypothetical protein